MSEPADDTLLAFTADIVAAHVSHNVVPLSEVATLVTKVHAALAALGTPPAPEPEVPVAAVSVRASVKPDFLICLEDGKKLKMLKRYLMTNYGMTPDDYRAKWGLPKDYPMVAPNYAETRRKLAKSIGLGRQKATDPDPQPVALPPAKQSRAKAKPAPQREGDDG